MSFPLETKQRMSSDNDLGHRFDELANAEGFITKFIDNADVQRLGQKAVKIEYCFKSAIASTAGATVQFYLVTADDNATAQHVDGGFIFDTDDSAEWTAASTPTAAQIREMVRYVHGQAVRAAANITYKGSFEITLPAARNWAIFVYNETGQALSSTAGDHYLRYIYTADYADAPRLNG